MEDDVRAFRDRLFGDAGGREIGGARLRLAGKAGGFFRRRHVDQRELVDRPAVERAVVREPLRELAADHAAGAGDENMHAGVFRQL